MKKLWIVLLFSTVTVQVFAQRNDKAPILKLLEEQRQSWNRGDIIAYMQGYLKSDSLVFVGKNGPEYGWDNTLNNYKKSYPDQKAMGYLKE